MKYSPNILKVFPFENKDYVGLHNLPDFFPNLKIFYTTYELEFNSDSTSEWVSSHYSMAIIAISLYLIMCYCGPKMMAKKDPFDLRTPLMYWNLCLSIFSFIGMCRMVPHLFNIIARLGFPATFVVPPAFTFEQGTAGFWTLLFLFSKYLELIDTVFLILRKKPINFLHWYHHSTVLFYTWDACIKRMPAGIYFISMNFSVHAFMYYYYYQMASSKQPRSWSKYVTIAQILQMLGGLTFTICSVYFSNNLPNTIEVDAIKSYIFISKTNIIAASLMYTTYLYLFLKFFYKRYFTMRKKVE